MLSGENRCGSLEGAFPAALFLPPPQSGSCSLSGLVYQAHGAILAMNFEAVCAGAHLVAGYLVTL